MPGLRAYTLNPTLSPDDQGISPSRQPRPGNGLGGRNAQNDRGAARLVDPLFCLWMNIKGAQGMALRDKGFALAGIADP
jgi:hypothetical protein